MPTRVSSAVAVLFLLASPLFAQAVVTRENVRVPFDFQITSCSGETVVFLGEAHILQQSAGNGHAGHFIVHINFHLEGTAPSGTRYVVNEQVNGPSSSGGATTLTSEARLVAVAQGAEDNLIVHTFIHFTQNANGEITAESFEFEAECQG